MHRVTDEVGALVPAVAFLLAGVPLAWLLDRLGFFDAVVSAVASRRSRTLPTWVLWALAAATTVVLNLDTTVVLLTPLYLRIARRAEVDPLPLVAIPLLLASLASSVLPVSNLTNLIAVAHLHVTVWGLVAHLGGPAVVAILVGWAVHRRRLPARLVVAASATPDRAALGIGGGVVAAVLVGFLLGPSVGVEPWMTALAADLALVWVVRTVPWRHVPAATGAGVMAVGAVVAVALPSGVHLASAAPGPIGTAGLVLAGSGAANVVNNLPAVLAGVAGVHRASWATWAWLLGVNTGAVLLPFGALANLLWRRIVQRDGTTVRLGTYLRLTALPGGAALVAAAVALALERAVWR